MNSIGSSRAVSPVVGVILVVAITVALSGVVGVFVFDLGENVATNRANGDTATRTMYHDNGTASIQVITGNPDALYVVVNGTQQATTTNPTPGTTLTVPGSSNSHITILSEADGETTVITSTGTPRSDPNPSTTGLVSHYPLDGDATDAAGSNDGTTTGDISYDAGVDGQAAVFDGMDDAVNIGDPGSLDGFTEFTLAAWVNPENVTTPQGIIAKWNGGDTWSYYLRIDQSSVHFIIRSGGNTEGLFAGTVEVDRWQHITATFDGTTARIYVDGAEAGSFQHGSPDESTANVHIGDDSNGGNMFTGRIDAPRIYNRSLTSEEVNDLYKATK